MPIVVNGTTIPENVANVLNVNGTNITSVVCDGNTVWTQNLIVREPATGEFYNYNAPYSRWDTTSTTMKINLNNVQIVEVANPALTSYSIGGWTYYRGTLMRTITASNKVYGFYRILN